MRGVFRGEEALQYHLNLKNSGKTPYDKFILRSVEYTKQMKVLDMGCGSGEIVKLLKNKCWIKGYDASKDLVKIAIDKNVHLGDITKLKEKTGAYDLIIMKMVLHHIFQHKNILNEVYRLLKPNGKFILIDYYRLKNPLLTKLYDIKFYFKKGKKCFFRHSHYSKKQLNKWLFPRFKLLKKEIVQFPKKQKEKSKHFERYMYLLEKD
ncbi:MAG: class I SAM-dependent methyltransferase [archaeon]